MLNSGEPKDKKNDERNSIKDKEGLEKSEMGNSKKQSLFDSFKEKMGASGDNNDTLILTTSVQGFYYLLSLLVNDYCR